ncbi:MAG: NAD(P)/FAD-dependent oxidoreductase [Canibacter sp.]
MADTVFETHRPSESIVDESLRDTQHSCFWIDDAKDLAPNYSALTGDTTAEDVVVGGGYAGLWTAIKLKETHPDRRVVLIEAHKIGWAASGRNGGFCEASITHGEVNGESRWPDEIGTLTRLGFENLDSMETFIRDNKLDAEFERTGVLNVANEPYQVAWAAETSDPDAQVLNAEETRQLIDSPTFLAGQFLPRENALVHPAKLAYALAKHADKIGVEIHEHTRATDLASVGSTQVRVLTTHGDIVADRVALCTNVFPSLLKRYRLHTVPVYDYVLMTEPLSDEQLESIGWKGREGLADMANQFHYSRLTADNRILWGGYDAVYHPGGKIRPEYEERPETYRKLASHFFTTFPQLEGVKFTHRWAGVIDTSTRFCAFFGSGFGGRVQHVAGFTGLGVGATHFAADVIVDRLEGKTTEITELDMVKDVPLPFPPEPIASLGVTMTQWAMNRADHNDGKRNILLRTLDALGLGFDS